MTFSPGLDDVVAASDDDDADAPCLSSFRCFPSSPLSTSIGFGPSSFFFGASFVADTFVDDDECFNDEKDEAGCGLGGFVIVNFLGALGLVADDVVVVEEFDVVVVGVVVVVVVVGLAADVVVSEVVLGVEVVVVAGVDGLLAVSTTFLGGDTFSLTCSSSSSEISPSSFSSSSFLAASTFFSLLDPSLLIVCDD